MDHYTLTQICPEIYHRTGGNVKSNANKKVVYYILKSKLGVRIVTAQADSPFLTTPSRREGPSRQSPLANHSSYRAPEGVPG